MNIIKELKNQGLTKWKISKMINVHWNTVNMWEKEVFKPTKENREKLKAILSGILNKKLNKGGCMRKVLTVVLVVVLTASNVMAFGETIIQGKRMIRVKHDTFKDVEYIDIREVFVGDDGEVKYTKKGVAIKPDQLNDLIRALKAI